MQTICGVDISKSWLDAHVEPQGVTARFANDAEGIAALAGLCRRTGVELVAMEATGGYERSAFLLLWQAGLPCVLANPRQVRRYAEAMGILEKTDRIDAGVIARFAGARGLSAGPPPSPAAERLRALVARLSQVTADPTVTSSAAAPPATSRRSTALARSLRCSTASAAIWKARSPR